MRRLTPQSFALALLAAAPGAAWGALQDRGPVDPATFFPAWYRDLAGVALAPCLADTPSPNASAQGQPMCVLAGPNPAGFPGNFGDEVLYFEASASISTPRLSAGLSLALAGAYAVGTPVRGDEVVLSRYRLRVDAPEGGWYRVVHPYGERSYLVTTPGPRAIVDDVDVGYAAGLFDLALGGGSAGSALPAGLGPFLRWDGPGIDPASGQPFSLTVNTPAGVEEYLGDPYVPHTVTGSPRGTNIFRIEGPPGSNLDGAGNDFVVQPLFSLVGKRYTAAIPVPIIVERAVYSAQATGAITRLGVHVFARAEPSAQLSFEGEGIPVTQMKTDGVVRQGGGANFYGQVLYVDGSGRGRPPATVVVRDASQTPPSIATAQVVDSVAAQAWFDPYLGLVEVSAVSSDEARPPSFTFVPDVHRDCAFAICLPVLVEVPPLKVKAISSWGGTMSADVWIFAFPRIEPFPVAVPDAASTDEDVTVQIPVLANDTRTDATILLHDLPPDGAAFVNPVTLTIDYTPRADWSGTDSLTYLLQDPATGLLSYPATVTITVAAVNDPPAAAPDLAWTPAGAAARIAVLVNDGDVDGTVVPGTVTIASPPWYGEAVANGDGTVTYAPRPGFTGADSFAYTVRDERGARSSPAPVTVTVAAAATEQLGPVTARWEIARRRWTVAGSSTAPGSVVTLHNGPNASYPAIGAATVDASGAFRWEPAAGTAPAPDPTRRVTVVRAGGAQATANVAFR